MNPIMEREICWWIPRLQLGERGAASWQDGGDGKAGLPEE
jgi:hypothetical protein